MSYGLKQSGPDEWSHSPKFEDDENYEIIRQLPYIYPEYSLSEWDFHEVTISDKIDTFEEELPAFNEYINWNYYLNIINFAPQELYPCPYVKKLNSIHEENLIYEKLIWALEQDK
ncbi:16775_t:CDS:2 [Gigaspora margarita]|uniref:16775_t:CDS:1 n=1 Tax=Gigaspora margarita TaxID=4874 RepID=A0ABN7UGA9_GIGMA|nr:16775_t:CDS:2 [Gigaspora margarita]